MRVDVKDGVGLKIFGNCDLFRFAKHSDTSIGSILKNSSQKVERNNTGFLNLGVFFESAFAVE